MDRDVAPESGLVINRGDVFRIEADRTRGAVPVVPHPHVVVREDVFNQSRIGPSSSAQ
jgi:mRNA interferase MazF